MKANGYIVFDEEQAACVGGHNGIAVYFDDEPEEAIIAKALEAVRAIKSPMEACRHE